MFCKKCGSELPENVKFCPKCGAGLEKVVADESKNMKRKGSKRKILIVGIAGVVLLFILLCLVNVFRGPHSKLTQVTLNEMAHSIFYAPMYVAIEEGYFKEEGLDVTLVTGFGADKTMTAVLIGDADIGLMGSESTIYTYVGGTDDYVVNFAQLTQRAGNFLVSREPIDNFSWDMLKGKDVLGGRAGGMPQMVFEYILRKNNIDPAVDLQIDQSIDFGSTAAAFSGGDAAFTVEFEPQATLLEQKGDGYVVASLGEDSGYVPYTAFSAKKSYIEQNGATIQAFTNALQKGMDYVQTHSPEEIADVIAPQFAETDKKALVTIVARYYDQDTWKDNLIFERDAFNVLQNILEDSKVLNKRVPYDDLVTTVFAEEAAKQYIVKDTDVLLDLSEVDLMVVNTQSAEGKVSGQAVLSSTNGETVLSEAKLLREQMRAENKEALLEIINSDELSDEQKQEAVNTLVQMTAIAEKETAAELLLEAKGFSDAIVTINDGAVDVVVNALTLTDVQRAQIEDIVKRKTEIGAENIVINTVVQK